MADQLNTGAQEGATSTAPEGHDEAMLQAYEQSQQGAAPEPTADPELILGKFKSQDELAAAYQELQSKMSRGETPTEGEAAPQEEIQQAAEEAVDRAEGVDMQSLSQEFAENGQLSDVSYDALDKAGIPREMVDQYIQGQEAQAEAIRSDVIDEVGGDDEFARMAEWAGANMDETAIERYNQAVDSGDPARMREAVQSLAYQYTKANGSEPSLVGGSAAGSGSKFDSVAQLTKAMDDPRYATDPAYRAEVAEKLSRSDVI